MVSATFSKVRKSVHELQAARFVEARKAATGFPDFPRPLPADLDAAYAIQEQAIRLWPDQVAGWKVGRIAEPLVPTLGEDRFIGPIFAGSVMPAGGDFRAVANGFAAFEAELVIIAADNAPAGKLEWTAEEARMFVGTMHIGVEVAGSPLASINDLGPLATIAAFGNNEGLILGAEIADWSGHSPDAIHCASSIDGIIAAQATASAIPGGPLAAFAFALGKAARLGRPMQRGSLISTGAITGILPVSIGQNCVADFGDLGAISCKIVEARQRR